MTFETWLLQPEVQAIGWALLHFLWQGALLAAILAVTNAVTRSSQSRLRYAIDCLLMLLMPIVFIATVVSIDRFRERSSPPQRAAVLEPKTASDERASVKRLPETPVPTQDEIPARIAPPERTFPQKLDIVPGEVVCFWLIGFLALSIYSAAGWVRAQMLRRRGIEPVDPKWLETLNDLMSRLRVSHPVRLYVSSIAKVPAVIGWLRPYILLPITAITGLSEPQLRAVLAHELAHIRRHDYLVNLLQNAIETFFFYHPAVWWVSRRIREERENCCDDLAIAVCGDVMMYAGALAELEELRANISEPALAATGGNLLARIRRLLGIADEKERIPKSFGAAMAAALVVSVVIGFGTKVHAQSETGPRFEVADVHRSTRASMSRWTEAPPGKWILHGGEGVNGTLRSGRYDLGRNSILELIEIAYDVESDKVLGGPTRLELDQFDIAAKAPQSTSPETLRLMLQALLADRFKLVLHKDIKPVPAFVLRAEKGPLKLKQADDSETPGCENQANLNPSIVSCRNITMEAFGEWLGRQASAYITKPVVVDPTGLKGGWDFDLKWNTSWLQVIQGLIPPSTFFDTIDKQLGLRLGLQNVPTPVLVVDHINENPTENPPDVAEKLPAPSTEFEVAAIRPTNLQETFDSSLGKYTFDRSGLIEIRGMEMGILIETAWDIPWKEASEVLLGAPKWIDSTRFDIAAKIAPEEIGLIGDRGLNSIVFRRMLRALLIDRFQMVTHYEDRLGPAYDLVAAHPKLRKADPSNRAICKADRAFDIGPTLSRRITCQNTTMAQFADQLRRLGLEYTHYTEISDATGIKGAWDFTVRFSPSSILRDADGGGDATEPTSAAPTDPNGAISLFDALKQQLGLKLEMRKRMTPMLVIDHIEEKPTEN